VFGFPIVLAFALGIAFRNRGPGELRVAVLRGAGDSAMAAALARAPGLTAAVLDSGEARLQLRTGHVALLVVPGDPLLYRYDSTRTESAWPASKLTRCCSAPAAAPIPRASRTSGSLSRARATSTS